MSQSPVPTNFSLFGRDRRAKSHYYGELITTKMSIIKILKSELLEDTQLFFIKEVVLSSV